MQFLKEKSKIKAWLKKYEITPYTLLADKQYGFVVNVEGRVDLSQNKLKEIPVKFNTVSGNFNCFDNQLTSLEFCPETVGGDFYCSNNQLISLEFCPKTVGGNFSCDNNRLTSLEFCPKIVGGGFYCYDNQLTSLEFCPETVSGNFSCRNNQLSGHIQEIVDFPTIYLEHKKWHVENLYDKLNTKLIAKGLSSRLKI